jgi:hypothetical protein
MALVSRDRPDFSRLELALDTLNLVAERSGEDLELLDLVVMVVVRRCGGRLLTLTLSDNNLINCAYRDNLVSLSRPTV